jgi:hypothetical protein
MDKGYNTCIYFGYESPWNEVNGNSRNAREDNVTLDLTYIGFEVN